MNEHVDGLTVAVDMGGTNTRVALLDISSGADSPRTQETGSLFPTEADYDTQVTQLTAAIVSLVARVDGARARGVGVSVGGRIARDGSSVSVAPNLPAYVGRPLTADLGSRLNLPVRLAHDTVCGLLGETRFGALLGETRCAYLTLSTGLGAAVRLAGDLGAGAFVSIEMGHQLLDGCSRLCLCGQVGCLETYVGGRQLQRFHGAPLESLDDPAIFEVMAEKLSLGLVNLAQLTRVDVVAVGGAIALARPRLLANLQRRVDDRLCGMALRLVPAALGERAPLVGAAVLLDTNPGSVIN